jgi:hypothetical protein
MATTFFWNNSIANNIALLGVRPMHADVVTTKTHEVASTSTHPIGIAWQSNESTCSLKGDPPVVVREPVAVVEESSRVGHLVHGSTVPAFEVSVNESE